jgi:AraC-like DNA-binding protein
MMSVLPLAAQQQEMCPVVEIEVEQLPDLNIPRAGHALFYANGELTVAGGHTDGFVPTPTAEYYQDGEWHTMPMTYTHDFGLSIVLKSGKVLLAGGCEQPAGIGQTIHAEIYDPQTHTFRGFGNLQRGRVRASALELDSGQVIIAGNWYAQDGIELFQENQSLSGDFKGKSSFTYIKDVQAQRTNPHIFRMADGDALIIGNNSTRGDTLRCTFADRLRGDTLHIPLLESWRPIISNAHNDAVSFIGDESKGDFSYLMAVQDNTGQVAIARVSGNDVTLLPTACPIPMVCQGDSIEYITNVIVDRQAHQAYLLGISSKIHIAAEKNPLYVLCINYDQASASGGAPMMLYYTQPLEVAPDHTPILTPGGNLLIAGGLVGSSNYTPSSTVRLLRVGREHEMAANGTASWWKWVWLGLAVFVLAAALLVLRRRRQKPSLECDDVTTASPEADAALMLRIIDIMERKKPYLDSDMKLGDLAAALGTNRNAISSCINSQRGCSFSQFVNSYRITHAQRLMTTQPEMKISEVWATSGFTTESSFFRTFKAVTGQTPNEWKQGIKLSTTR